MSRIDGAAESLAIPQWLREQVDGRDQYVCRVCGEHLGQDRRAVHHIQFGAGTGARRNHELVNLITVGWLPGNRDCHGAVHGHKKRYQGILNYLATGAPGTKGVTALQLLRWRDRGR